MSEGVSSLTDSELEAERQKQTELSRGSYKCKAGI